MSSRFSRGTWKAHFRRRGKVDRIRACMVRVLRAIKVRVLSSSHIFLKWSRWPLVTQTSKRLTAGNHPPLKLLPRPTVIKSTLELIKMPNSTCRTSPATSINIITSSKRKLLLVHLPPITRWCIGQFLGRQLQTQLLTNIKYKIFIRIVVATRPGRRKWIVASYRRGIMSSRSSRCRERMTPRSIYCHLKTRQETKVKRISSRITGPTLPACSPITESWSSSLRSRTRTVWALVRVQPTLSSSTRLTY